MGRARWIALLAALLLGCGNDLVVPVTTDASHLVVHLAVYPEKVAVGEPFTAMLALENKGEAAVRLSSGCSTLTLSRIERDGVPVSFKGSSGGCLAVGSTHWIGPKDTRTESWHIQALDYHSQPVDRGEYTFVVDFQTSALPDDARVDFIVR